MGRGKTAFLTELVHEEIEAGREPICHFIDYHPSATGEGDTIVRSLLDQLRAKYPDLKTPEAWQTRPPDLPAQLEWTLRELSDRHRWGRDGVPPEVIYIDAADQAEADERRPLLPGFLRHLPPGVACVITTRPDRRWLRTRRGVTVWYLDQATEAEMAAAPDEAYETDDELADLMGEALSDGRASWDGFSNRPGRIEIRPTLGRAADRRPGGRAAVSGRSSCLGGCRACRRRPSPN